MSDGKLYIRLNIDFINACDWFQMTIYLGFKRHISSPILQVSNDYDIFVKTPFYYVSSPGTSSLPGPGMISPRWSWTGRDTPGSLHPTLPPLLHSPRICGVSEMLIGRSQPRCMLHQRPRASRVQLNRWRLIPLLNQPGGWLILRWVDEKGGNVTFLI